MGVKMYLYGGVSIVVVVLILGLLGGSLQMLKDVSTGLTGTSQPTIFQCGSSADCKQDPNDCASCINILSGGLTILSKCRDEPIPCYCVNNQCTTG